MATKRRPGSSRGGAGRKRPKSLRTSAASPAHAQDYSDIFRNNPMPMWVFDLASLRILAVNEAAVAHYGYSEAEFLSMTIKDIRSQESAAELERYVANDRPALKNAGIWKHRKRDGSFIDVEIVSHEIAWNGHRARLVSANDVTERLQAEARILELNTNLEALVRERTQQLESVNRELEAFSYSVSHDLRAPLRVIDGFSQALMEDYAKHLEGNGSRYLSRIRVTTQRMGLLIDDLLTLARISRRNVKRGEVDLSALASEVVRELREKEPAREVAVRVEPGMRVAADRGLVKIALDNLVGNAWKFTSRTPAASIEIGRERLDGAEVFYVRDNGAGFEMQYAHKLFGAFQRLHAESDFTGTGIGLATVQRIVTLHHGRIWAEAEPGRGAVFRFTLDRGNPDE
ncbi:MAG TPA: ATP-binding protein [Gammaproteobacteria bacterium]|nr:ATP-binding protein [Gammaproteobacteria bacterium]